MKVVGRVKVLFQLSLTSTMEDVNGKLDDPAAFAPGNK